MAYSVPATRRATPRPLLSSPLVLATYHGLCQVTSYLDWPLSTSSAWLQLLSILFDRALFHPIQLE